MTFAGLCVAWTIVVGASLAWSLRAVQRAASDHALGPQVTSGRSGPPGGHREWLAPAAAGV